MVGFGKDAADRRTGNQVKPLRNRPANFLFQIGQDLGRVETSIAPPESDSTWKRGFSASVKHPPRSLVCRQQPACTYSYAQIGTDKAISKWVAVEVGHPTQEQEPFLCEYQRMSSESSFWPIWLAAK